MVRAHPTVPASTPFTFAFPLVPATSVLWPCGPTVLANPGPLNHNSAELGAGGQMTIFRAGHFGFGSLLAMALAISISPAAGQGYTPEQEQACSGDAFRPCSAEIPDVGRVTACMVARKSELSPPCRAQFGPDPEPRETTARPAGRPTDIRPATPRKAVSVKPRKAKQPAKPAT